MRARNNGRHELWKSPKHSRHAAAQANDRFRLVGCLYAGSPFPDEQRRCELGKPSMTYRRVFTGRRALLALATCCCMQWAMAQSLDTQRQYDLPAGRLRSEESRVGKKCVSTGRYRGSPVL